MKKRILIILIIVLIPTLLSDLYLGSKETPFSLPGDLSENLISNANDFIAGGLALNHLQPAVLIEKLGGENFRFGIPSVTSDMSGAPRPSSDDAIGSNGGESYLNSLIGDNHFGFDPLLLSKVGDFTGGGSGGYSGLIPGINPPPGGGNKPLDEIKPLTNPNPPPEETTPVPEPGTMLLLGSGLLSLVFGRKRFLKKK
jgi:hypothetical protein